MQIQVKWREEKYKNGWWETWTKCDAVYLCIIYKEWGEYEKFKPLENIFKNEKLINHLKFVY